MGPRSRGDGGGCSGADKVIRSFSCGIGGPRSTPGTARLANPLMMWVIQASHASVGGVDLGEIGAAPEQAQLRDFALPQRGMLVVGRAFFTDGAAR